MLPSSLSNNIRGLLSLSSMPLVGLMNSSLARLSYWGLLMLILSVIEAM